jgi:beta-glucosidase/6-phospho-beta-glucosidase/beta-galactosidase
MAGFECSSHRRHDRRRLDILNATRHDELAESDYRALHSIGMTTVRDGLRWHLIETAPFRYDWSSFLAMFHAARKTGTEVIWDLFHYGWPDDLDIFAPAFLKRFHSFVRAFAKLLASEGVIAPMVCPVNEINFLAWEGGDEGDMNPWTTGRGDELKRQLVRAAIIATETVWEILPAARVAHCEPAIHIFPDVPGNAEPVAAYVQAQYQAWDMIAGNCCPELGGKPEYLDLIGINFYPINEWIHHGRPVFPGDPLYRPLRDILSGNFARYGRPLFIAETGIEGEKRVEWLAFAGDEVRAALARGVPVQGLCWYPIVDYPGWIDERQCCSGVLSYPDENGLRQWFTPLKREIERQQRLFEPLIAPAVAEKTG